VGPKSASSLEEGFLWKQTLERRRELSELSGSC
jgi:hypothetical protein